MRCNNYDNSGSSSFSRVVKKSDAEENLLQHKEIGSCKLNGKRKAYTERGKVYVSCSFIEVSLSEIEIDIRRKIENAEQLRDITRNILRSKTCSLHEIVSSKNGVTSACNFEKVSPSSEVKDTGSDGSHAQVSDGSTSFTKRCSKKTASRPKREKRQTILPSGEIKKCAKCKDTWTIQWRSGPDHNRELCSPCGLAYGKRLKKEDNEKKRQEMDEKKRGGSLI